MKRAGPLDRPVAIVGNGPVGQSLALLLARWGVPSVLFDRAAERTLVGSRAICQHRDVLDVWASVGAGERIATEGLTWSRARTYYRDRELFVVEMVEESTSAFPPFVNISQSRTEQILAERVARCDLIEERWGVEVERVHSVGDDAVVQARDASGAAAETRFDFAVLAAGARGASLREHLGIGFPGRSYDDRFLICDIRAEIDGWSRERRFYFDPVWNPGRQVLIHPCPDGVFRIDWQVAEDFDYEQEAEGGGLDRRIRAIVGERTPFELVWSSVYRFQGRCAETFRSGSVFLAGDVAHLFSPFGARGLNSGVQDAENLAWKLAFVRNGWADPVLLDSYEAERRAAALRNLEVTETTMRFLVPQTPEAREHRRVTLEAALGDAQARARVDSGRLFESASYAESPLMTASARTEDDCGLAVGRLLPDVRVVDPADGMATSLRQLVRTGIVLLGDRRVTEALRLRTSFPMSTFDPSELRLGGGASPTLSDRLPGVTGRLWILRPDAYVAASLPLDVAGASLERAVQRCVGGPWNEVAAVEELS